MELAWIRNCSSSAVGNLIFNEGAAEQENLQFLWKRHDLKDFLNFNMNAIDSAFLTNEEKEELKKIVINSYNCKENI